MQELDKYFNEAKDHEVLLGYTYKELSDIHIISMLEGLLQSDQKINKYVKDNIMYTISGTYVSALKYYIKTLKRDLTTEEAKYIYSKINDLNNITIKTYHRTKKGKLSTTINTYNTNDIKLLDKIFDIISETKVSLLYIRFRPPPNFNNYDWWFYHKFFSFTYMFLMLYNIPLNIHQKIINFYRVLSVIMKTLNNNGFINSEDQTTFSDFLEPINYCNYYNIGGAYKYEWNDDTVKRKVKLFQTIEKYKNIIGEEY
jgi:hypothetical protein